MAAPLIGLAIRTGARLLSKTKRAVKQTKAPTPKSRVKASKAVKTVKNKDLKGAVKKRNQTKGK